MIFSNTIALTIVDPCSSAVFQTTPNPFTDMTIVMPQSTTITQAFHIMTDVELLYPGYHCPISASFITSWVADSVVSSTERYQVSTSSITLPADIGTRLVTIRIRSLDYPTTQVAAVQYSFNVII